MSKPKINSKQFAAATLAGALLGSTAITTHAYAIDELLVTATRRAELVQDIPYNISAVSGDVIDAAGITDITELSRVVPGLTVNDRGSRGQMFASGLVIRGMNADRLARISAPLATISPVATYIGDTPIYVNLDMMDIERVEVLRGPQGTLYGSGSLGGTIRFIQKDPELGEFGGQVSAGVSQYEGSDDWNYNTSAILNVPVSDKLAVRLNARRVDNAGYIDKPNLLALDQNGVPLNANPADFLDGGYVYAAPEEDTNTNEVTSFRAAAHLELNDTLNATLNYYYQENESGGANTEAYNFYGKGSDKNAAYLHEEYEGEVNMVSLEVEKDFGFATLSSSSSWSKAEGSGTGDHTGLYENFAWWATYYGDNPRGLVAPISTSDDERFTQEFRLVSNGGGDWDWIIGAFYQKNDLDAVYEDTFRGQQAWNDACIADAGATTTRSCGYESNFQIQGVTPNGLQLKQDVLYMSNFQSSFEDIAVFGELTYHINDSLDITGGFRAFDQEYEMTGQSGTLMDTSAWDDGSGFFGFGESTTKFEEQDILFKGNISWHLNDDTMVYGVISEGFRRGGANALNPAAAAADELTYDPDTVVNYEAGIKGSTDRLSYTLAAFMTDWSDIQINKNCFPNAGLCVVNAGDAETKGIEAEIHAEITDNFRIDAGYSYTDSEFKDVVDPGVVEGKVLPGAPENTFNATAWYDMALANEVDLTFMLSGSYRSETSSQAVEAFDVEMDDFWMWNASVAASKDQWTLRLFVNNIADEEGYMSAYSAQNASGHWGERAYALRSTPRTIGLQLTADF